MNTTRTSDWTAHLTIRIPQNDGGDLVESATRRLETRPEIDSVDVVALRGLEPALSATIVHVDVRVDATTPEESAIEESLADAPGTECIERLEPG